MGNNERYISDIISYLKRFERLGARYDLNNPDTGGSLFTTLLAGCLWPTDTTFIHPANDSRRAYADVWGIRLGLLQWPVGLVRKLPGKLTVCGIADGGNWYLVVDENGYMNAVDHEDGEVSELEDDAVFIDNLLIESEITRALIELGYPKKPFGEDHLQVVLQLKPKAQHDVVAYRLALSDHYFSKGEIGETMSQLIHLLNASTYFPDLSARERDLMRKILQSENMIQAPEATELKRLLAHQLRQNHELEPWLRDVFFDYVMAL